MVFIEMTRIDKEKTTMRPQRRRRRTNDCEMEKEKTKLIEREREIENTKRIFKRVKRVLKKK